MKYNEVGDKDIRLGNKDSSLGEKDSIRNAMKSKNYTFSMLASALGYTNRSAISDRIYRGSMRTQMFLRMMDAMGYDVVVTDRENGESWTVSINPDELERREHD